MSEMSFEQMLDETFKTIHNGEVLEGKVISVRPDEAVLNIGYKADGILTSNEYSNTPVDLTTVISVGDELTVKVLKVNDGEGQVALSYKKLAAEKANKRIEEAFENKEVLKAPVVQILKGGLSVDVEGGRVFIPASLVSDAFERDLDKYLNQEIEFVVTEFNPKKRRIIGDRKQLLVAEKKKLGFPVPIRIWLKDEKYYNMIKKAFTSEAAEKYFNTDEIVKYLDDHKEGKADNSRKIWTIYMFLVWYEDFFGNGVKEAA